MSATIVTFANLGKKQNLKTPDILPLIATLARTNELRQVICLLHKDFYFKPTKSAIPAWIWYPVRALEKLGLLTLSRPALEMLFDYFARFALTKTDVVIFHGGHFLERTFHRAQQQAAITVDLTVTAHTQTNARIEREEYAILGLSSAGGMFTEMNERAVHSNEFDYVVAISDFVKRSYLDAGFSEDHIFVACPDIDTGRFLPQQKKDSVFRIVYAAYTTPLKGMHYLLDAWDALVLPNAELVIIGGYGYMPPGLKEVYDSRIAQSHNILWVGNTATPETFYTSASVMVSPSLTEGNPHVIMEAMACGLPVVTTEHAQGLVEDGKTGFVVPIRDANAIAEKIQYLYDHQDIATAMGREARKVVENKKPFGEAIYEIYEEIMRREGKALD